MSAGQKLDQAFSAIAGASGIISGLLVHRKISRELIQTCIDKLEYALKLLKEITE